MSLVADAGFVATALVDGGTDGLTTGTGRARFRS